MLLNIWYHEEDFINNCIKSFFHSLQYTIAFTFGKLKKIIIRTHLLLNDSFQTRLLSNIMLKITLLSSCLTMNLSTQNIHIGFTSLPRFKKKFIANNSILISRNEPLCLSALKGTSTWICTTKGKPNLGTAKVSWPTWSGSSKLREAINGSGGIIVSVLQRKSPNTRTVFVVQVIMNTSNGVSHRTQ